MNVIDRIGTIVHFENQEVTLTDWETETDFDGTYFTRVEITHANGEIEWLLATEITL